MFGLLGEDRDRGQEALRFMGNVILREISAPTMCSLQSYEARFCGRESLINFIYIHPIVRGFSDLCHGAGAGGYSAMCAG